MADKYSSLVAVTLDAPCEDVELIVKAAGQVGDVDRAAAVRGTPKEAMEVHWGGRMQKAVVRALEGADGTPLLRTETYVGSDGLTDGMQRQAQLLPTSRLAGKTAALKRSSLGRRHPPRQFGQHHPACALVPGGWVWGLSLSTW